MILTTPLAGVGGIAFPIRSEGIRVYKGSGKLAGEVLAGSGIGMLVGLLLGLSVSPVVGSVLSGLAALLAAFFGLSTTSRAAGEAEDDIRSQGRVWRLTGFGFVCALAVLVGLFIRANNVLMTSPESRIERWTRAGYSRHLAKEIVAFQELGVAPKGWEVKESTKTRAAIPALFRSEAQSSCETLAEARYANAVERARAFQTYGGKWSDVAAAAQSLSTKNRAALLESVWQLVCE